MCTIRSTKGKLTVGYIDDVALLTEGQNVLQANAKLKQMMERWGGVLEWARAHTLGFALEKTALVEFNRYLANADLLPVTIDETCINPAPSHKFLGVMFDSKLTWAAQRREALKKVIAWVQLIK